MIDIDILIEDERWAATNLTDWASAAAEGVSMAVLLPDQASCAIMACDDTRIAALNAEFREKPRATNVLSWPSEELSSDPAGAVPRPATDPELGDIAIALDTCLREAVEQNKTMADHVTHLLVHAMLHLLGFDHIDDADATRMETLEVEILAKLNISNPYEENDGL